MTSQRSTDAPQNLVELQRWRKQREAFGLDDFYLAQIDRKWRSLGRLAAQPASAALRRGRPIG